ncbi:agamous-like MADS-box protein AGL62 [Apium graveolens]|uniref:agamous-like MADS-box protein AGL62 n=1 Tax=Apium graveolens TaxID=4045 RepID=UPI003D7BE3BF
MIKNKATRRKKQREVKPIDGKTSRQITFSKRRFGVFKKASELCVLTGAETAVLCESVGRRVFAFGHPSVEHVVDKYLGTKNSSATTETHVNSSCMLEELKKQYLEIEKNKSVNKEESDFWWQQPFDHLGEEELEEYISSMENLRNNLELRANDLRLIRMSSSMLNACNTLNSDDTGSLDEYVACTRILL